MKFFGIGSLVVSLLLIVVGRADALTCTAPGHPTCTITCRAGCGAKYIEPNGPCRTICSRVSANAQKLNERSVSSQMQGLQPAQAGRFLGSSR